MNFIRTKALASAAMVALLLTAGSAFVAGKNSASGTYTNDVGDTVTFSATSASNNSKARGTFTHDSLGQSLGGSVERLFVAGNVAYLSGVLTRSDNSSQPVGTGFILRVTDNAGTANPDSTTYLYLGNYDCKRQADRDSIEAQQLLALGRDTFVTSGDIVVG